MAATPSPPQPPRGTSQSHRGSFWNGQCLWCPKGERTEGKPRKVLECRSTKARPLPSFPPPGVTVNGFQVLRSSISCLLSYPTGRRYLPYSSPTQYTCLTQSANDPQDPSHSVYPGCRRGPRSPVQRGPSPELLLLSPALTHLVSLSSCLMSGNSPTCTRTRPCPWLSTEAEGLSAAAAAWGLSGPEPPRVVRGWRGWFWNYQA